MVATRATARASARLRVPDVWHGGTLQAISRHATEATLLRMTMLSASVRREMSEPSFKLHTGLCRDVVLDFDLEKDEHDYPYGCVREGRRRGPLAKPFMRYAGEVCEHLQVNSFDLSRSYPDFLAICELCPRLKCVEWDTADGAEVHTTCAWHAKDAHSIARACPLLEEVNLSGLPLPLLLSHFANLRVVNIGWSNDEFELTTAADAALCRFLKRRRTCPGLTLHIINAYGRLSNALIRAVGVAPITKVTIERGTLVIDDREGICRMLAACTRLETLELYFPSSHHLFHSWAAELSSLALAAPSITELAIVENRVDDPETLLASLTALDSLQKLKLNLYGTPLSPEAAEVLHTGAYFPQLVELGLAIAHEYWVDQVMVEVLERIVDARPNLRVLTVPGECFPEEIEELEELRAYTVSLAATLEARGGEFRFEDEDPEGFGELCRDSY